MRPPLTFAIASSLDPPVDAGPAWTVGHYLLICKDGGASEICVSDATDSFPGTNAVPGGTLTDCTDECNADEYVVAYGGIGPDSHAAQPSLPPSCRFLGANPGGTEYDCCPCD